MYCFQFTLPLSLKIFHIYGITLAKRVLLANGVREDKKVCHLLSGIGATVLRNLLLPTELKDNDLISIKENVVRYCNPKPPVVGQQFVFHQRTHKPGESINQFVMELDISHLT